ncbi:MAG: GNAT family N-acetyltransferase [Cyanobacteria bacterium HKST-UBA02]|nr:GNAT family N-acetyltransferase [Cyanobacteria bacterium HKST-UBA02]
MELSDMEFGAGDLAELDRIDKINQAALTRQVEKGVLEDRIKQGRIRVLRVYREIAGIIYWSPDFMCRDGLVLIEQLAVSPDYRRLGLGSQLLRHCLDFLKESGVKRAFVDVEADNGASLGMCLSHGGIICGVVQGLGDAPGEVVRTIVRFDLS